MKDKFFPKKALIAFLVIALIVFAIFGVYFYRENAWKLKFDVRYIDYKDGYYVWEIENKSNATVDGVYVTVEITDFFSGFHTEKFLVGKIRQKEKYEFSLAVDRLVSELRENGVVGKITILDVEIVDIEWR